MCVGGGGGDKTGLTHHEYYYIAMNAIRFPISIMNIINII